MESRYFVFAGSTFYLEGGAKDLKASFQDYDEALLYVAKMANADWWQIVRYLNGNLTTICEAVRQ